MLASELKAEIARILGVDPSQLRDDSSAKTIPNWDSMASMEILSYLDDVCPGEIGQDDADNLTTFSAIISFAREKGVVTD